MLFTHTRSERSNNKAAMKVNSKSGLAWASLTWKCAAMEVVSKSGACVAESNFEGRPFVPSLSLSPVLSPLTVRLRIVASGRGCRKLGQRHRACSLIQIALQHLLLLTRYGLAAGWELLLLLLLCLRLSLLLLRLISLSRGHVALRACRLTSSHVRELRIVGGPASSCSHTTRASRTIK